MNLKDEIREKLGKSTPETPKPQVRIISKKVEMSPEMKRIFQRIDRNLQKVWGYDNTQGKEKNRPKYRNLWEDWEAFREWIESL